MLVMVVFFIAFRWIHLSTPLIRLFLLVLILLLMPTLNFLPVWFALSLLRFRLPSRLPMMFILWMRSEERRVGKGRSVMGSCASASTASIAKHVASDDPASSASSGNIRPMVIYCFSSRRRHTRSVSAFLLNRSSDLLLLMPTLNFLPVWFALSLLRFRLPSRLPMMFILWMVAMMVVIIPSRTV